MTDLVKGMREGLALLREIRALLIAIEQRLPSVEAERTVDPDFSARGRVGA